MTRFFKFFLLALLLLPIAFIVFKCESNSTKNMKFDGEVVFIDWKSRNHNLPLIKIMDSSSKKEITFSHYTIVLKEGDLLVGDQISKSKGSRECVVNEVAKKCIQ